MHANPQKKREGQHQASRDFIQLLPDREIFAQVFLNSLKNFLL